MLYELLNRRIDLLEEDFRELKISHAILKKRMTILEEKLDEEFADYPDDEEENIVAELHEILNCLNGVVILETAKKKVRKLIEELK